MDSDQNHTEQSGRIYDVATTTSEDEARRLQELAQLYDPGSAQAISAISLPPKASVLELGPGVGSMTQLMLDRMSVEGTMEVIDLSFDRFVPVDERLQIVVADLNEVELTPTAYDFIYSRSTLGIIERRKRLLQQCATALNVDGMILIETVDFPLAISQAHGSALGEVWDAIERGGQLVGTESSWMDGLVRALRDLDLDIELAGHEALFGGTPESTAYWTSTIEMISPLIAPQLVSIDVVKAAILELGTSTKLLPGITRVLAKRTG